MKAPWWRTQLPEVERLLRGQLRQRLPSRPAEHDDLVNETLLGLARWVERHEGEHAGWVVGPATEEERGALFALAQVLLRRRLADQFRLDAREWRRRVAVAEGMLVAAPASLPSAERTLLLRRMLEITVGVLATMSAEDRDLLAIAALGEGAQKALEARERQRLRRARQKLATAISAALGAPAAELLRRDD